MAFTKITRATTLINDGWGVFNTLIDDLLSVSNGKGASQIGIEDSAGNVAATNVEDAIAEVYTDHATTKNLAETFDENPVTTTGLVWGYKGGLYRLDSVITTVAAGTISVADDDVSYVEIIPSSGNVSTNTTGFTSGRIPLRQITVVSGTQTVSTDKRAWFSQVAASTTTTSGIVELATNAEVVTGTDTGRAIVPSSLTAKTKDEDNMASDSDEHLATQQSIKAYIDTLKSLPQQRALFVYNSDTDITIGPAVYHHVGTTTQRVYWDATLTYTFANLGTSDWSYLYLDDSAIVTADTNVISASELADSVTEPSWSDTKKGWYNGEDKCIFAVLTDGDDDLLEFWHDVDTVIYTSEIVDLADVDIDTVWTDVILTLPGFVTIPLCIIEPEFNEGVSSTAYVRTNGSSGNGMTVGRVNSYTTRLISFPTIITDSNQTIEVNYGTAGSNVLTVRTYGWKFPSGM